MNAVLRDELVRYASATGSDQAAEDFLTIARTRAGRSGSDQRAWSRDSLHLDRFDPH